MSADVVAITRLGVRHVLCKRCGRFVRPLKDNLDRPASHVRSRSRDLCRGAA